MGLYETTTLYLGLATLVAALTVIWYSRSKSAELDAESRRAFKPLYIVALGFIAYAIGNIGIYIENVLGIIILAEAYIIAYVLLAVEIVALGIAAAMILNSRRLYLLPIASIMITLLLFYLILLLPSDTIYSLILGIVVPGVILGFVGTIFISITRETKRSTSLALAYILLIQIIGLPSIHVRFLSGSLQIAALFFLLMAPGMVAFTFLRPDQKVSLELIGYGTSFAGALLILAYIQNANIVLSLDIAVIFALSGLAVVVTGGSASYLYGRYLETKQIPTLMLSLAFLLFAYAQIIGTLGASTGDVLSKYIEFISSGSGLALLSTSAIYATGRKSISLLPLLAITIVAVIIMQSYPGSITAAFNEIWWLVIPVIAILLLPAIIFLAVWRRMRMNDTLGRMRPLGLAIGILLYFLARVPPLVTGQSGLDWGYGLVSFSYLTMWFALTGRLDKYLVKNQEN